MILLMMKILTLCVLPHMTTTIMTHFKICKTNKNIFIGKPLCLSLNEFDKLKELISRKKY